MAEPKVVIPNKLSVMAQPEIAEVEELSRQGYRAIINNRPDSESPDQPAADDVRAEARKHGIHYEHMPVTLDSITREDVLAFRQSFTLAPAPVIAHCRTGKRSFLLWAAGEVIDSGRSVDELVAQGAALGLDIKELPQVIERISE